jgi:hypothetical protein
MSFFTDLLIAASYCPLLKYPFELVQEAKKKSGIKSRSMRFIVPGIRMSAN